MENKDLAIDAAYCFVKNFFENDDNKSPEMIIAISELLKSLS